MGPYINAATAIEAVSAWFYAISRIAIETITSIAIYKFDISVNQFHTYMMISVNQIYTCIMRVDCFVT